MPEAIMQRTYGKSNVLNIEKIYVNDPADDEILIKQTAIGIHFHDVYVRTGLYKTNLDIGLKISRNFDDEIIKYSYNWRTGGQFAENNNIKK